LVNLSSRKENNYSPAPPPPERSLAAEFTMTSNSNATRLAIPTETLLFIAKFTLYFGSSEKIVELIQNNF